MPTQVDLEQPFLSVKDYAALVHSTPQAVYVQLCKKKIPEHLYTRYGRKLLFIRERVVPWILDGAKLEQEQ
jgi:hypothetical protein